MLQGKNLKLLPLLFAILSCRGELQIQTNIELEDKTYYEELFTSLSAPYTLNIQREELIIYKFYSPWCPSCMEELSYLQNFVRRNSQQCKLHLFTIFESDKNSERFGFKAGYIEGLFEKTKYQQVPLTFIFKNKKLVAKFAGPLDTASLQDLHSKLKPNQESL